MFVVVAIAVLVVPFAPRLLDLLTKTRDFDPVQQRIRFRIYRKCYRQLLGKTHIGGSNISRSARRWQ